MILCAVLLLPLGQQPNPPPQAQPNPSVEALPPPPSIPAQEAVTGSEDWGDLDRVILIVNEEMLTYGALVRAMSRENRQRPFAGEGEAREAANRFHVTRVREALRVQAGQDLGLDPAQVDRMARDHLERRQEELGGPAGMAAFLESNDMTLFEMQEHIRDLICAEFWDNYITGGGSAGQARASRDRYVRPGYLRYAHRSCLEHPELLPRIGGQAQAVVLQQLFLDPRPAASSAGDGEADRALADDLRKRIVEGEDMGDLVERYDASKRTKAKRGMTEPLIETRLAQIDPAVGAFVAQAKPGDVSEVLDYKTKDGHEYLRIVRLVERTPPVVPDLTAANVQKKLGERVQADLSEWRLEQAYKLLYRDSYVWPSEYASR